MQLFVALLLLLIDADLPLKSYREFLFINPLIV